MRMTTDQLYKLLPAIYRIRDTEQGEPLKALVSVITEQAAVLEEDIAQLYENWFIETCSEWVVPYIGDMLGVRGLHSLGGESGFSQRARVANTLRYRRRKGTATVLEQLAFDTTGWRARAVEFFQLLETTQYANHIRLQNVRTPDIRQTNQLELLDTAFDTTAHTADVRSIRRRSGWHNIPNVGLFLWRLQSYAVTRGSARPGPGAPGGCFTFNPLGIDVPLFNRPQTEEEITHLAEEINVPGTLRRRPLYDELEARRQSIVDNQTPVYTYFDDRAKSEFPPVLEIFTEESSTPISPDEILICDLSTWHTPPDKKSYEQGQDDGSSVAIDQPITVAVDPLLGRLAFPASSTISNVQVNYAYSFSGDVGGGPYDRQDSVDEVLTRDVTWQVGVSKDITAVAGVIYGTLAEAIAEWNTQSPGTVGVIAIMDSRTYEEELTGGNGVQIPEGSQLMIVAADWPEVENPASSSGEKIRMNGDLEPDGLRPHLHGNISVTGTAPSSSSTPGQLVVDGLLIEGSFRVLSGNLGSLRLAHCTLVPANGGLNAGSGNQQLTIDVVRSICGPVNLTASIVSLNVKESIIDGGSGLALSAGATAADIQKSTILGKSQVYTLDAGNSLFTDNVKAVRLQTGCVRFCFVPPKSATPRRFRCQPDLEINERIDASVRQAKTKNFSLTAAQKNAIRSNVISWLVPHFTSRQYGDPSYGQLGRNCPSQISGGSEDGSEMGAFSILQQPQREANLVSGLEEYLRFGLEAGIIYVT